MQSRYHIMLSGGVSLAIFIMVEDPFAALSCFIVGVFMDVDHLVDYWIMTGELTGNTTKLLNTIGPYELVFIPFHSWELLVVMMILTPVYPILWGSTIGFFFHMLGDVMFNHARLEGFLLMYRVNVGWRKEHVFERYHTDQE